MQYNYSRHAYNHMYPNISGFEYEYLPFTARAVKMPLESRCCCNHQPVACYFLLRVTTLKNICEGVAVDLVQIRAE